MIPAGSTEYTKANNIYDLAGNASELTLEGDGPYDRRYERGGNYVGRGSNSTAHYRSGNAPYFNYVFYGFRAYFYIK